MLNSCKPPFSHGIVRIIQRHTLQEGECNETKAAHSSLFKQLTIEIRRRGYSIRTEQTYASWICRFVAFLGNGDPASMGPREVLAFLEYLALGRKVSPSTQNLALNLVRISSVSPHSTPSL